MNSTVSDNSIEIRPEHPEHSERISPIFEPLDGIESYPVTSMDLCTNPKDAECMRVFLQ